MPGKTPQLALDNYLTPLRRSLACVTAIPFAYTAAVPNKDEVLTLSEPFVRVLSRGGEEFGFTFHQDFRIQRMGKDWKVFTLSYRYRFQDGNQDELLVYHWHPAGKITTPHLHVPCAGAVLPNLHKAHLPTRRIFFEDFLLCLIEEFGILARADYQTVLSTNREVVEKHCSWK